MVENEDFFNFKLFSDQDLISNLLGEFLFFSESKGYLSLGCFTSKVSRSRRNFLRTSWKPRNRQFYNIIKTEKLEIINGRFY